jgi:hypothetical protein
MNLELRESQARELERLLEYHTRELLQQIDKADDRDYRDELLSKYDLLNDLRKRLLACLERESAFNRSKGGTARPPAR